LKLPADCAPATQGNQIREGWKILTEADYVTKFYIKQIFYHLNFLLHSQKNSTSVGFKLILKVTQIKLRDVLLCIRKWLDWLNKYNMLF